MKTHLTLLTLSLAGVCAATSLARAEDAVPPKPPGGDKAPAPAADKGERKPEGRPERGAGAGRMDPEARLKMMTERLGLTQEQQDKIKAIYEKNSPEMKELMAKGRENLNDAEKEKARELMKSQMEEIGAVLTPEQKEKMREARAAGGPGGDRKPGERRSKPGDAK